MSKSPCVLLITPPMVQLNTPYPATPVLTGFLKEHGVEVYQADLSLEVALKLFTPEVVEVALNALIDRRIKKDLQHFVDNGDRYRDLVLPVVRFLQGRAPELAWRFASPESLPEGRHFLELTPDEETDAEDTLTSLFGSQGIEGRAKMRASLFLDDLAEYLAEALDSDFAFAKYAEHLAVAAPEFEPILTRLNGNASYVDRILEGLVEELVERHKPDYIGVTVPFPGTVYGAFRIAKTVRGISPDIKTVLGGGYVNSELRDLTDERIFDYFDFISYDEGFAPFLGILGLGPKVRTRTRRTSPKLLMANRCQLADEPCKVRISDYTGLDLSRYLSLVETTTPMHRLWSDGRWLKVQLASGCYWHKCKFCDVALDYIGRYAAPDPKQAVDAMAAMRDATGLYSFHFTDEAIPPALCKGIAEEIIARGETLVWWGNIRFDKGFTPALANLMARSGCIAVTGGLECACDRLLAEMSKGITCAGAKAVCRAFASAGILVHTYLMYDYPSETRSETVAALDFVRKLFAEGSIQSAFWHRFALTVHSPLAADPPKGLKPGKVSEPKNGRFALNEIPYEVEGGRADNQIGEALSLATYNYMIGRGLELPAKFWFDRRKR